MNVKTMNHEISRIMKIMSGIANSKTGIASNVEIETDDNGLHISAANGAMWARMSIPMFGLEQEKICVDCAMLGNVLRASGNEISLISDGKTLTVKSAGRTRMPILDATVPAPEDVSGDAMTVNGAAFADAVSRVAYAVSVDESRPILQGILMEPMEGKLQMVALDGFRLAMGCCEVDGNAQKMILPAATAKSIVSCMGDGDITVQVSHNHAKFTGDGAEIVATLMTGDFIDYNRILPKDSKTSLRFNREHMRQILRSAAVASGKSNLIRMEITGDNVTIASNGSVTAFDAALDCEVMGDSGLKIAFNSAYLSAAVDATDSEYITMDMTTQTAPAVLKPEDSDGLHLILPVRVTNA